MSRDPDEERDREIARQRAKFEPGDSRKICSRCLNIREEEDICTTSSKEAGEPICNVCCVRLHMAMELRP